MKISANQNKFNLYVFLTTFSRNLIEVFIPVILYNYGYSLKEVITYYLFVNVFSLLLSFLCGRLIQKFGYQKLSLAAVVAFGLMQLALNNLSYSFYYLLLIAFLFATYRRFYWIPRRYYNLTVIKNKNVSITYAIISIVNQLGVVFSTYIGSLLLDFVDIKSITSISVLLFVIGIMPLRGMSTEHKKIEFKLFKTLKTIPLKNIYLFGTYELINVLKFLFALYLFIYVKNSYSTIGILNLVTNVSIMIFTYMYGRKISNKRNYLNFSILLTCIICLIKVNVDSWWLIPVSFCEGIFMKMYEISINKEFYSSGKKYESNNYNYAYEFIQNITRTLVVLLLFFVDNLKYMIYIVLFFIIIGSFIQFQNYKIKDN